MARLPSILVLFAILGSFINLSAAKSRWYDGDNKPYNFGFDLKGSQHRQESKDSNGIIMGEFGFLTGDGVYHVTVYATDEDGNYKVLSMKNLRQMQPKLMEMLVSSIRESHQRALGQHKGPPATTPAAFKVISTTEQLKTVAACSDCKVPVPTHPTQYDSSHYPRDYHNYQQNVDTNNRFGSGAQTPISQTSQRQQHNQDYAQEVYTTGQQGFNQVADNYNPNQNFYQNPATIAGTPAPDQFNQQGQGQQYNFDVPQGQQDQNYNFNPPHVQQNQPDQGQNYGQQYPQPQYQGFNVNPGNNYQVQSPVQSDLSPPRHPAGIHPGVIHTAQYVQNPASAHYPTQESNPNYGNVPQNTAGQYPAQPFVIQSNPADPTGQGLLYKFDYAVGYHGHNEEGDRAGRKEGSYYFVSRDGIKHTVEYKADESGYHPTIKEEAATQEETPREETEKEAGLKHYNFQWF